MRSRPEWDRARELDWIREHLDAGLIYIPLTWHVYERDATGEGIVKVREVEDLHLLVSRRRRRRWLRRAGQIEPGLAELLEHPEVERHPLDFTTSEHALELALDETHRVVAAFGGQRGSKTHTGAQWFVRQWMLKGGRNAVGWWLAPSREQAQKICVEKLVEGKPGVPPLLSSTIVLSHPDTHESGEQTLRLVDGTRVDLYPLDHRAGGNVKGFGPAWLLADEICEVRSRAAWRVLRGRATVTGEGKQRVQIFMPSTPMPGHWAKEEIVDAVDRGSNPDFTYSHLAMSTNVFIPASEVASAIKDAGGPDDPTCRREVFGEWDGGNKLFPAFNSAKHIVDVDTLEALGLRDVTPAAVRRAFGALTFGEWVAGHDFNRNPANTVIAKVGVPVEREHRPELEVLVVLALVQSWNGDAETHGHLLAERWPALPIVCDPQGAQVGFKRKKGKDESPTEAMDLARAGHHVITAHVSDDGHPYSPPVITSVDLMNRLLRKRRVLIHRSAVELISSLQKQTRTPRGGIDKSTDATNRASGPTDAWRYLGWALYIAEAFPPKQDR